MEVLFGLLAFLVLLYCLYRLTKDDFVFLRKNISLEHLFNLAFQFLIVYFLSARLIYGIFHPSLALLNPFVFFIFPLSSGLSFAGGMIGGMLYLFAVMQRKKLPAKRILDFFCLSFLIAIPVSLTGYLLVPELQIWSATGIGLFLIATLLFFSMIYPGLIGGRIKEGYITGLFLFVFSLISLCMNIVDRVIGKKSLFVIDDIVFAILLSGAAFVIFKTFSNGRRQR